MGQISQASCGPSVPKFETAKPEKMMCFAFGTVMTTLFFVQWGFEAITLTNKMEVTAQKHRIV
jgi:hypothetical protein